MDNPVEILSSPLDEMIDMYIKECLERWDSQVIS